MDVSLKQPLHSSNQLLVLMTSLIFVNDYDMLCAQDMQWYVTVMSCDPSGTLFYFFLHFETLFN